MKTLLLLILLALPSLASDYQLGSARDWEQIQFSQQVLAVAKSEGGTVKISTWVTVTGRKWYCQRLIDSRVGVNVWQGPNPPTGYHDAQRTCQIITYQKP